MYSSGSFENFNSKITSKPWAKAISYILTYKKDFVFLCLCGGCALFYHSLGRKQCIPLFSEFLLTRCRFPGLSINVWLFLVGERSVLFSGFWRSLREPLWRIKHIFVLLYVINLSNRNDWVYKSPLDVCFLDLPVTKWGKKMRHQVSSAWHSAHQPWPAFGVRGRGVLLHAFVHIWAGVTHGEVLDVCCTEQIRLGLFYLFNHDPHTIFKRKMVSFRY